MNVEYYINMMFVPQSLSKDAILDYAYKTGIVECFGRNRSEFQMCVKNDLLNRLGRIKSVKIGSHFYLGSDAERIDPEKISVNRNILCEVVRALYILLCLNNQCECLVELREFLDAIMGTEYNDDIQKEYVDRLRKLILGAVDMSGESLGER